MNAKEANKLSEGIDSDAIDGRLMIESVASLAMRTKIHLQGTGRRCEYADPSLTTGTHL